MKMKCISEYYINLKSLEHVNYIVVPGMCYYEMHPDVMGEMSQYLQFLVPIKIFQVYTDVSEKMAEC